MGRAKQHMEPIHNHKKRKFTFLKRKDGLLKKAFELTELCDVNVSMTISIDNQEPQRFPQDPSRFNGVIDLYKRHTDMEPRKVLHYSLLDFLNERKKKIEEELANEKKKNMEAKYPTWFDFLNKYSEVELREFAFGMERKIDLVKSKIESLKNSKIQNLDHHSFYPGTLLDVQSSFATPTPSIDPSPLPTMIPNDIVSFPAHLFSDNNTYIMKSETPNLSFQRQSTMMIPLNYNNFVVQSEKLSQNNYDNCYDYKNFDFQCQSPMMIPINNSHLFVDLYADSSNVITQSENPELEILKMPTSGNEDWYDYEKFSLQLESPTFWFPSEIPELSAFMQMNPV